MARIDVVDHRKRASIRIAITNAAFDALAGTLPLGTVRFERGLDANGERLVWLASHVLNRLRAVRGPGESYTTWSSLRPGEL